MVQQSQDSGESDPICIYLGALKADWRSSPAGDHWHRFYEWLCERTGVPFGTPPKPLILAASGASDREKFSRLKAQLEWAREKGCLEEALAALDKIPPTGWNRGLSETWDQDNYY